MQAFQLIASVVLVLILTGYLVIVGLSVLNSPEETNPGTKDKRPPGYWMSLCISAGAGVGLVIGLLLQSLAIWIAIGAVAGAGFGWLAERVNSDKARPLTQAEKRLRTIWRGISLALVGLGVAISVALFLVLAG